MGTVQKIKHLSESGKLTITADCNVDDNQLGYFWYFIEYIDVDGTTIVSHDPTLEGAVNSVYATLGAYISKLNTG